jgi:hypothetical protein
MTEAVKPPVVPAKPDPITEGVQARLRHLREALHAFGTDLEALKKLETALLAAAERLERHTSLIGMETQLLEALLKRDSRPKAAEKPASVVSIVDRVEADLQALQALDARPEKAG